MYKIKYSRNIIKNISKIPVNIQKSIKRAIEERLTVDPILFGKPLKGEWKGCYRLRAGDYRIIYEVNELKIIVLIIKIGNRDDVYV